MRPIDLYLNSRDEFFTPATDIYALGTTLYKLLTSTTPLSATRLASGEPTPRSQTSPQPSLQPTPNMNNKNKWNKVLGWVVAMIVLFGIVVAVNYLRRTHYDSNSESYTKLSSKAFTVNGITFMMTKVEGGTFNMGATSEQQDPCNDEKPVHQVTLSTYYIGETEVTQALWTAVMGSNPSAAKRDNYPVEQVSWNDCQEFIKKLNSMTGENFRLPTEAEWEFAARGGNNSQGYQYSGSNNLSMVAWYACNGTHDVKIKSPNELGIYDMCGNVFEWCQDWYGVYGSNSVTNPTGAASGAERVNRGGSWLGNAWIHRLSLRYSNKPDFQSPCLGLRLAL